jgi:uncharacterized protein YfkK (UPF0435 family)
MAGRARQGSARRGAAGVARQGVASPDAARLARHGVYDNKARNEMNTKLKKIKEELEIIRAKNGGILSPEKVVEYARDKKTALHEQFTWDDSTAGELYRIQQAAGLIRRIKVEIIANPKTKEVVRIREYVSLPQDRKRDGGYRQIEEVYTEDDKRLQFIESVRSEFQAIRKKLKIVSEAAFIKSESVNQEIEKQYRIAEKKASRSTMAAL